MINPKELRIDNWVLNPSNDQQHQVSILDINDMDLKYKERLPIQLTPEVLEKCGFTQRFKDKQVYDLSLGNSEKIVIGKLAHHQSFQLFELQYEDNDENKCIYSLLPINSVHQLQNLYFTLTNKELIYNF